MLQADVRYIEIDGDSRFVGAVVAVVMMLGDGVSEWDGDGDGDGGVGRWIRKCAGAPLQVEVGCCQGCWLFQRPGQCISSSPVFILVHSALRNFTNTIEFEIGLDMLSASIDSPTTTTTVKTGRSQWTPEGLRVHVHTRVSLTRKRQR